MNVLVGILKYPPDYAGDGLRLHRMFQRLKLRGIHKTYVLTSWDQSSIPKQQILDGIRIFRPVEYTNKLKYESFGRFLKKTVIPFQIFKVIWLYSKISKKVDLILTVGSGWFPSLIGWLAVLSQKPLVKEIVLLEADDPISLNKNKSWRTRWFFIKPFHHAKLIITISSALKEACLKYGLPADKIWSRLNPVTLPILTLRQKQKNEIPIILWVGKICRRKNVEFLLTSARFLRKSCRFIFVGPSDDDLSYAEELRQLTERIPKWVQIEFLGHVSDQEKLAELYANADLFWFSSHKEGMGNVVAEALISGVPVVTLPVLGIMKELIRFPEEGQIVDTQDPEKFAEVVTEWLAKPTNRHLIQARAGERFQCSAVDNGYLLHFDQLIESHKPIQLTLPPPKVPILVEHESA